ncbi:E3 ubiquitin-protein ligase RNF31 isoform X3 [Epinephelus fuscoguttatus]|uniref:E3 ubiquitin-protein ligase RNF31 isoform X3 n=1 Tax=Epinephelus fuscoguttatus TaxID=293821 RepID=UPI0020CFF655|nr:E3 ubiquitin-protein ligase RNF31 isoform X3 [Epinephelus fuscoguttatus]
MPKVGAEAELRTLTECQYRYPGETLSDLQRVRSLFSDLRLYVDFYCFPNKEKKKLVYLAGTLPVLYEGSEYNIPVCIWLHETHPVSRPRCFVCPSVSMVINPSCSCVDASGNISLDGLKNWTHGVSNLSLLVSEMRRAFQRDTPLYARSPVQAPPPAGVQVSVLAGSIHPPTSITSSSAITSSITSSFSKSHHLPLTSSRLSGLKASQWEQSKEVRVRRSYTEELLGIDFSAPPPLSSSSNNHNNPFLSSSPSSGVAPADPLSRRMGALRLDTESSRDQQDGSPVQTVQSEAARDGHDTGPGPAAGLHQGLGTQRIQSEPAAGEEHAKMAARLPPDKAAIYLSLMTMEGRSFSPGDVMEAVQLNRDFPLALKFLTHSCPICQEQVSFSKRRASISWFVLSVVDLRSKVREGWNTSTCWTHRFVTSCHLKSTNSSKGNSEIELCRKCRTSAGALMSEPPQTNVVLCLQWSPQHQGLSCHQFRVWQQQNQPDHHTSTTTTLLSYNSIECPNCQFVFSLSKGGCLHFTCSQCQHQFCGGCSQPFSPGSACRFSADCGTKGLHAHHPRDCLYHLRDWSVPRLHLLLQYYRVSPTWLELANNSSAGSSQTGLCLVLELRDDGGRREEPCGRLALPEYRGYCQMHYKERLVELINRCCADPAVLFSPAEMMAELQRWNVAMPTRKPEEPEPLYTHRLRLTLTNSVPLRKPPSFLLKLNNDL